MIEHWTSCASTTVSPSIELRRILQKQEHLYSDHIKSNITKS